MKQTVLALTMAAALAPALFGQDHLQEISASAKGLKSDYGKMDVTLRNKNFDAKELQAELKSIEADLSQLQAAAKAFEASHGNLPENLQKEWKGVSEAITLLDIFHDQKSSLLEGDNPRKQRGMLRAHAQGLAKRAAVLETRTSEFSRKLAAH